MPFLPEIEKPKSMCLELAWRNELQLVTTAWQRGGRMDATIESAYLSIARKLAIEIADRHTQSIERHSLTPVDPLYGLKPTTRLDKP